MGSSRSILNPPRDGHKKAQRITKIRVASRGTGWRYASPRQIQNAAGFTSALIPGFLNPRPLNCGIRVDADCLINRLKPKQHLRGLQANGPKLGALAKKGAEVGGSKLRQGFVSIILHVGGGQVGIASVLMPPRADALLGAEIISSDEIMADAAHPMAAEEKGAFVGGGWLRPVALPR